MSNFADDFGEDEDFGLGGNNPTEIEAKPSMQAQPVGNGGDDAMEDELYGDLAPAVGAMEDVQAPTAIKHEDAAPAPIDVSQHGMPPPASSEDMHASYQPPAAPMAVQPAPPDAIPIPAMEAVRHSVAAAAVRLQPAGSAIYIGNLPWHATDIDVEEAASVAGTVMNVTFLEEPANGKSQGAALVEYREKDAAVRARDRLNDRVLKGRMVVVALTEPPAMPQQAGATAAPSFGNGMPPRPMPPPGEPPNGSMGAAMNPMAMMGAMMPPGMMNPAMMNPMAAMNPAAMNAGGMNPAAMMMSMNAGGGVPPARPPPYPRDG